MNKCKHCDNNCVNKFCSTSCSARFHNIRKKNPTLICCLNCNTLLKASQMKINDGYCSSSCLIQHETTVSNNYNYSQLTSKQKGDIGEYAVILEALRRGFTICNTIGDNARYDIMIDTKTSIERIQIKTVSLDNGSICVPLTNQTYDVNTKNNAKKVRYSSNDIDYIFAVCLETLNIYKIGSEFITSDIDSIILRVDPPKNNQRVGIQWAHRYLW